MEFSSPIVATVIAPSLLPAKESHNGKYATDATIAGINDIGSYSWCGSIKSPKYRQAIYSNRRNRIDAMDKRIKAVRLAICLMLAVAMSVGIFDVLGPDGPRATFAQTDTPHPPFRPSQSPATPGMTKCTWTMTGCMG